MIKDDVLYCDSCESEIGRDSQGILQVYHFDGLDLHEYCHDKLVHGIKNSDLTDLRERVKTLLERGTFNGA